MGSPIIYDFLSKPLSQAAIEKKQEERLIDRKTAPAIVVGVQDYEEFQCLDVQVAIDDVYVRRNNLVLESIILKKIFVALPYSGGFMIKQPVAEGDPCRLQWSNKDLGQYLEGTGGKVSLDIHETGELEDCWVVLDGGTRRNNTKPSVDNLVIEGPNTSITITPDGTVTVETEGTSYLKSSHHTIDTDVTITKTLTVTESIESPLITASQSLIAAGDQVVNHNHGGVSRGSQNTDNI